MHIILTGATGLVGSSVLNHVIQHAFSAGQVSRLSVLSRSPVPMADGKKDIQVIIHKDYSSYPPELLAQLQGADGCIWAQGVSQTQVSKEDYQKITFDYPLAAAKAFASLNTKFTFLYVSGEGATQNPGALTPRFGRIKGAAETALLELQKDHPSLRAFSVRPGMVDPTNDPEVRNLYIEKQSGATTRRLIWAASRTLLPSQVTPTQDLGRFLTGLTISGGEPLSGAGIETDGRIVRNSGILRIVKEGGVP